MNGTAEQRAAIVTGASRGIGAAIAERLEADGWRVARLSRRAEGQLGFACDVADRAAVDRAVGAAVREMGGLDLMVANAGQAGTHTIDDEAGEDAWERIRAVNLDGAYFCAKAAVRHLRERRGRLVVVASTLGLMGVGDQLAYCAAKHGAIGLVRALAMALAKDGVTVNAVCPGWTETEMAEQRFAALGITRAEAAVGFPSGDIAEPSEVAGAVAYLASHAARNVTGQCLVVDGGATAGWGG